MGERISMTYNAGAFLKRDVHYLMMKRAFAMIDNEEEV